MHLCGLPSHMGHLPPFERIVCHSISNTHVVSHRYPYGLRYKIIIMEISTTIYLPSRPMVLRAPIFCAPENPDITLETLYQSPPPIFERSRSWASGPNSSDVPHMHIEQVKLQALWKNPESRFLGSKFISVQQAWADAEKYFLCRMFRVIDRDGEARASNWDVGFVWYRLKGITIFG